MKAFIYLSYLLFLTTAFCSHNSDSENQRRDENLLTSSEYSRDDHHDHDSFERDAGRKKDTFKRIPAIRRVVPGDDEHESQYTKKSRTRFDDSEKRYHEEDDHRSYRTRLSDDESDHVDYQPEEYPSIPIRPSSAPPSVVFVGSRPAVGRREIHLPVYRRPSYSRVYGVAPVSYRTLNSVAYSVPRVRNVVLGYPSPNGAVRYAYGAPDSGYEVVPEEYRGFIAEEYDDFLKKKK